MLTALLSLALHRRRRPLLTSGLWTGLLAERLWRSARWHEREVVYVEWHVLRVYRTHQFYVRPRSPAQAGSHRAVSAAGQRAARKLPAPSGTPL